MKLLFAECCQSLVVPNPVPKTPRYCACGLAACWWLESGSLGVWHHCGSHYVSVVGLHNGLLRAACPPGGKVSQEALADILADTPSDYLFKQLNSLVVRFRPGATDDVFFLKDLP